MSAPARLVRGLLVVAVTGSLTMPVAPSWAVQATPKAIALLERALLAARLTPYSGIQFMTSWNDDAAESVVVHVEHVVGQDSVVELLEAPADGDVGGVPSSSVPMAVPSTADGGLLALISARYRLTVAGVDRVAGRTTRIVEARRPDGSLAARWWLDTMTGLVLRHEVMDGRGRIARAAVFLSVQIRPANSFPVARMLPPAWNEVLGGADLGRWRGAGYAILDRLPGGFALLTARLGSSAGGELLHLGYSDGLSSVSVFEQQGRLDVAGLRGWVQATVGGVTVWAHPGLSQRLSWSGPGVVYSIVTDATSQEVAAVVRALPHGERHRGLWSRLVHGLSRIGSWFNPFG